MTPETLELLSSLLNQIQISVSHPQFAEVTHRYATAKAELGQTAADLVHPPAPRLPEGAVGWSLPNGLHVYPAGEDGRFVAADGGGWLDGARDSVAAWLPDIPLEPFADYSEVVEASEPAEDVAPDVKAPGLSDEEAALCPRMEGGEHDWRVDPYVVLATEPPRFRVVCAACHRISSVPGSMPPSDGQWHGEQPSTWPNLKAQDASGYIRVEVGPTAVLRTAEAQ